MQYFFLCMIYEYKLNSQGFCVLRMSCTLEPVVRYLGLYRTNHEPRCNREHPTPPCIVIHTKPPVYARAVSLRVLNSNFVITIYGQTNNLNQIYIFGITFLESEVFGLTKSNPTLSQLEEQASLKEGKAIVFDQPSSTKYSLRPSVSKSISPPLIFTLRKNNT